MSLLIRRWLADGRNDIRSADRSAGELIDFAIIRVQAGASYHGTTERCECALVVMSGVCTVHCAGQTFEPVGRRMSVFDGKAFAVFVPSNTDFEIVAQTNVEVAECAAPSEAVKQPALVTPDGVVCRSVGKHNWRRDVYDVVGANVEAERLLVGETINPPGNWSSYPPHKHDADDPPNEAKLEEIYHFRVSPERGFGTQRVYTAEEDLDETYTVRHCDTVVIPRGYHPVAAAPGYRLHYLWVLAGEARVMRPSDDPAHTWVKAVEPLLGEMGCSQ